MKNMKTNIQWENKVGVNTRMVEKNGLSAGERGAIREKVIMHETSSVTTVNHSA